MAVDRPKGRGHVEEPEHTAGIFDSVGGSAAT